MEELDKTFSSLVQSEALLSLTEPGKMNALKALVNKDIPNERLINDGKKPETFKQVHFYDGSRCCKIFQWCALMFLVSKFCHCKGFIFSIS